MTHNSRIHPDAKAIFFLYFYVNRILPSVKWPCCRRSTVQYHFKAVVGLFHSKSDCMGRARTSPDLLFHEDKIPEREIMLYMSVSATLPCSALDFCIGCNMQRIATHRSCVC